MKCAKCKREINRGSESQKMITVYKVDGEEVWDVPSEGKRVTTPGKQLIKVMHYKCGKVIQKIARRTSEDGSLIGKGILPTAYEVEDLIPHAEDMADGQEHKDTSSISEWASKRRQAQIEKVQGTVQVEREHDPGYDPDREEAKWPGGETVTVDLDEMPTGNVE